MWFLAVVELSARVLISAPGCHSRQGGGSGFLVIPLQDKEQECCCTDPETQETSARLFYTSPLPSSVLKIFHHRWIPSI
ncbi:hypothetical protein AGIG_G18365 [Arapaima gigas]